jgi:N utilization substance protein B
MGKRRKAREGALQILYQLEFDSPGADLAIEAFWKNKKAAPETKEYSGWLVTGILSHLKEIDEAIQSISEHWRIARMALVDRNILRLAAFEMLYTETMAPAIVINEAIEIAKKYSGPEAATFVNGILDALRRKIQAAKTPSQEVQNVRKDPPKRKPKTARRSKKD